MCMQSALSDCTPENGPHGTFYSVYFYHNENKPPKPMCSLCRQDSKGGWMEVGSLNEPVEGRLARNINLSVT